MPFSFKVFSTLIDLLIFDLSFASLTNGAADSSVVVILPITGKLRKNMTIADAVLDVFKVPGICSAI